MDQKTIEKYLKGITSSHERNEVMGWIEKEEKNKKDFLELRKLYDISVWNAEVIPHKKVKRHAAINNLWRAAAVFLVLLSMGLSYLLLSKSEIQMSVETVTCPQGQRLELFLSDGTKVWLNSNSTLSFRKDKKEKNRTVELDGEAYFDVIPDKNNPFIVKTETHDITVLGTSFNVFAYRNSGLFECSLVEGVVRLKSASENTEILLQPNEKIRMANGVVSRLSIDSDKEFLWKIGIYSFKNQPLSEVFAHISLLHEVKIELKNPLIGNQMCTGKFRNKDGIDHILSTLQKNYRFSYLKDEDSQTYTIY
ncbi:MAG: FecR domain-containing protein [Tannerella sp.]|jgi:ferric-dicitrate binding protein FerR (iron transport regulator)|nr:FecR domain-containing protein [Tannerella sp.]